MKFVFFGSFGFDRDSLKWVTILKSRILVYLRGRKDPLEVRGKKPMAALKRYLETTSINL
jgi:hypothetical protein